MKTVVTILALICTSFAQKEMKPRMEEVNPQIIEPWQVPCNEEVVTANLELKSKEHVFGRLTDPSGAPLGESRVLLRRQNEKRKFVGYRDALTDKDGRFDLKLVELGKYRFLPGPNRGWRQPKNVLCSHEFKSDCELNLVLELNPTDQPFNGCPIQ